MLNFIYIPVFIIGLNEIVRYNFTQHSMGSLIHIHLVCVYISTFIIVTKETVKFIEVLKQTCTACTSIQTSIFSFYDRYLQEQSH